MQVIDQFFLVFEALDFQVFLVSALLFFVGYVFAPTVLYKKIGFLTAYPLFIAGIMEKYAKKEINLVLLFSIILVINTLSMLVNLISGFGLVLPVVFSIFMGINMGVIIYHQFNGQMFYVSLINPVAMIELPCAWISFSLAIQYAIGQVMPSERFAEVSMTEYLNYFLYTIIPLLIIADIIEVGLIRLSQKIDGPDDDQSLNK